MGFSDEELIALVKGFSQLAERVGEMRGQMDAQQIVISHLAAGASEEAKSEAHVALALAAQEVAGKDEVYRRGFEQGMALYRSGHSGAQ